MAEYIEIEPLGDHGYLMRIRESAEEAEVRFQASTAVLAELNITGTDEAQIVTDDQPPTPVGRGARVPPGWQAMSTAG
jgi:hypothetical protein